MFLHHHLITGSPDVQLAYVVELLLNYTSPYVDSFIIMFRKLKFS